MKNTKIWESLVWVVIWVFILSFSLVWIINILNFNKDVSLEYADYINKYILEWNADNVIKKLDITNLDKNEKFYVYKNDITKEFEILTWTLLSDYKYVNKLWRYVWIDTEDWNIYKVEYTKKEDILKHIIYPDEIANLIFRYDATNIDWSNNSTLIDWWGIVTWLDLSSNENAYQNTTTHRPKYIANEINGLWWVKFDWVDDMFYLDKNGLINNDDVCLSDNLFTEKSFAIVLKTWLDVTRDQAIYEQWWQATWYNFMIHDGDLYAWIHNKATVPWYLCFYDSSQVRDAWHLFKSVNLWEILPDSTYFIMIVQDSTHKNETGNPTIDDANNKLKIYLNGELASETDHVDPQPEHHLAGLWSINEWNVRPWAPYATIDNWDWDWWCNDQCLYYEWSIGELISWNHALSRMEVRWIQNYFTQKWLAWRWNVKYSIVDIDVNNYNK